MYRVVFIESNGRERVVEAEHGQSLMQCAVDNMIPGIAGECGGCCSCATCHAYVAAPWLEVTGLAGEEERCMIEGALDPMPSSRLLCQVAMSEALDGIVIQLPAEAD